MRMRCTGTIVAISTRTIPAQKPFDVTVLWIVDETDPTSEPGEVRLHDSIVGQLVAKGIQRGDRVTLGVRASAYISKSTGATVQLTADTLDLEEDGALRAAS